MYTAEEVSPQGYVDADYQDMGPGDRVDEEPVDMTPISQEQRKALFRMVHDRIGQEQGNSLIQAVLTEYNLESTTGMPTSTYKRSWSVSLRYWRTAMSRTPRKILRSNRPSGQLHPNRK